MVQVGQENDRLSSTNSGYWRRKKHSYYYQRS